MGQVLIRNLDDAVILRHKQTAKRKGVSLEQHLRDLIAGAAKPNKAAALAETAALLAESGYVMTRPAEDLIREDRSR